MQKKIEGLLRKGLAEYAKALRGGWEAAEPVITKWRGRVPMFEGWCKAIRIMARADQLLQEQRRARG
jgi:hypothetical protein